ncbi:MAG TPA: DUF3459 domain-containing protein, partial [Kofleriaceae bacterium]|nr:DUF3459 domain-containing protein [Kofleriaceae bacterium]
TEMLAWYRALIAARRDCPELRDPAPESIAVTESPGMLEIRRGRFALRINLSRAPVALGDGACVLASQPVAGGELPPDACALVRR